MSYEIETTPEFYKIKYTYDDSMDACGNWFEPKPQCSVCSSTMFSFVHDGGSLEYMVNTKFTSWNQCLFECSSRIECFMVVFEDGSPRSCLIVGYGYPQYLLRHRLEDSIDLTFLVAGVKYTPDNSTCSLNFSSFSDGRDIITQQSVAYSSYKIDNFKITWIPRQSCKDADAHVYPGVVGCYKVIPILINATITQPEANEYCLAIGGGGLMTAPDADAYKTFHDVCHDRRVSGVYIGIMRDGTTNDYAWILPQLKLDTSAILWATNGSPFDNHNCSIFVADNSPPDNIFLLSIDCDTKWVANGMICYFSA